MTLLQGQEIIDILYALSLFIAFAHGAKFGQDFYDEY